MLFHCCRFILEVQKPEGVLGPLQELLSGPGNLEGRGFFFPGNLECVITQVNNFPVLNIPGKNIGESELFYS